MLTLPPSVQIYLATEPVDLRRGHDGLVALVRNQWRLDPFAGHLFVFVGRRGNRVKILFWDRSGLWVCTKRLEIRHTRDDRLHPIAEIFGACHATDVCRIAKSCRA